MKTKKKVKKTKKQKRYGIYFHILPNKESRSIDLPEVYNEKTAAISAINLHLRKYRFLDIDYFVKEIA